MLVPDFRPGGDLGFVRWRANHGAQTHTSSGEIGDRIIATMRPAVDAGGEAGPWRSAGMKLVREVSWPVADLRCD